MKFVVMYAQYNDEDCKYTKRGETLNYEDLLKYTETKSCKERLRLVKEQFTDFEEMMGRFVILCRNNQIPHLLVIETESNKVVCQYCEKGTFIFNRYLTDGVLHMDTPDNGSEWGNLLKG